MNRQKQSSGQKFQWKPAKNPATTPLQSNSNSKASMPTSKASMPTSKASMPTSKAPVTLANTKQHAISVPSNPDFPKTFSLRNSCVVSQENLTIPTLVPLSGIVPLNTYLGPRGYTIPKSELTDAQLQYIRKTLTVRPVAGGAAYGAVDTVEFPIYRESSNKIYMPRFFGKSTFGEVKRTEIHPGDDISIEFAGSLRPIQVPVVDAYVNAVTADNSDIGGGGLLELPCAFGKTVLSLSIIAKLRKKTLVIVNKEFLLNQWVERISQFLPTARVGRIQGPEIDIKDKDIVIGMLQSISMKDYDSKVFESFGLTIIDEVHHISSEVFSRALFKIVSKYMLGLSATMDRKDGTTYVFKQFLGEVVFKGEREEGEHDVEVRAIEYVSTDAEFNKVELDFRGNPKYSTMIVKLCEYGDRSDFIVRVIKDLVKEQPGAQIMILAHNRSILTYLHDSIVHQGFATAGYYVGGMKEASLKMTEEKQVVVATYAMAAEALDIKTLNTLVMVTPKTDIVQSVGRILREKHDKPLVIDIVDRHDVFKNQWVKRRRYYKKCEYTIKMIDSVKYRGFDEDAMMAWKLVYRSAAKQNVEKLKCIIDVDSSDEDDDSEPKKPTGPQKCMVVLEDEEDDKEDQDEITD